MRARNQSPETRSRYRRQRTSWSVITLRYSRQTVWSGSHHLVWSRQQFKKAEMWWAVPCQRKPVGLSAGPQVWIASPSGRNRVTGLARITSRCAIQATVHQVVIV